MKRTRNYYKISIPAKKMKSDGKWEESKTTPRIIDLYNRLCGCLVSNQGCEDFLTSLKDEECTDEELKEVALIQLDDTTLLHNLVLRNNFNENPKTAIGILQRLIELDRNIIYARDHDGKTPLSNALLRVRNEEAVELLLNADTSKTSILMKSDAGYLPLHTAMLWRDISLATVKRLCVGEHKKQILDSRTRDRDTPIHFACRFNRHAFPFLVEERIQLVTGIPNWRQRLRELVAKYQRHNKHCRVEIRDFFMDLFNKSVSEFEDELPEVIALLQLAVWKGRELPNNAEERRIRWITSGAQQIARGVAEFLGCDAGAQLQHGFDRWKLDNSDDDDDNLDNSAEEDNSDDSDSD